MDETERDRDKERDGVETRRGTATQKHRDSKTQYV